MWPGYSGTMSSVRHLQPIPSMHQLAPTLPSSSHPQHAHLAELLSSVGPTGSSIPSSVGTTIALQHLGQNQRAAICVGVGNNGTTGLGSLHGGSSCLSEDEVTVQTPLMVKRESTV